MYRSGSTRRKVSGRRQRSSIRATGPGAGALAEQQGVDDHLQVGVVQHRRPAAGAGVAGHLGGDPGVPADHRGPHVRLQQLQQVPPGGPAGGGDPGQLVRHAGAGRGAPR